MEIMLVLAGSLLFLNARLVPDEISGETATRVPLEVGVTVGVQAVGEGVITRFGATRVRPGGDQTVPHFAPIGSSWRIGLTTFSIAKAHAAKKVWVTSL